MPFPGEEPNGEPVIRIDGSQFRVERRRLTGAELRSLPSPPVPPDRDLFMVGPAEEEDRLITDAEIVETEGATEFFTAPRTITAGQS